MDQEDKLRHALAETLVDEPSNKDRLKEFQNALVGNTFYMSRENINPTVFFVHSVELDSAHKDILIISGTKFHICNYIYPMDVRVNISDIFLREHSVRIHHLDGEYEIWNKATTDYSADALKVVARMSKRLAMFRK